MKIVLVIFAVVSLMGCAQQVADIALGGPGSSRPAGQRPVR